MNLDQAEAIVGSACPSHDLDEAFEYGNMIIRAVEMLRSAESG